MMVRKYIYSILIEVILDFALSLLVLVKDHYFIIKLNNKLILMNLFLFFRSNIFILVVNT